MKILIIISSILTCFQTFALSEGTYQVIIQKQQQKMSNRWSLADYLSTKKRMALMDQWLAFNTSADYFEFAIWGQKNDVDFKYPANATQNRSDKGNEFGALGYYRIIGIETHFEEIPQIIRDKRAELGLRIFGKADQGNNLKLHFGLNEMKDYQIGEKLVQRVYGGSGTIYLLPFLGAEGGYRKYAKNQFKTSKTEMDGEVVELSAFLDIFFVRLYYKQQEKSLYYKSSTQSSPDKKTFETKSIGVRLYF